MTQLHILQNNFTNNGFANRFEPGNTDHPGGPDWRGFMFYHEDLEGEEHLMVVVTYSTDFDWRCKDILNDKYIRWVPRDTLAQAYVGMLHEWIEENGGIS